MGLLNSQCHFGTQAPPEVGPENVHQAATIIAQPSMDVQAQTLVGISFSPSLNPLLYQLLFLKFYLVCNLLFVIPVSVIVILILLLLLILSIMLLDCGITG